MYVYTARSYLRHSTGPAAFRVQFDDGEEEKLPITWFMDLDFQTISHDTVTDFINDQIKIAEDYPDKNRKCLCCARKSVRGQCYVDIVNLLMDLPFMLSGKSREVREVVWR